MIKCHVFLLCIYNFIRHVRLNVSLQGGRKFIPCLMCWWQEGSVEGSVLVWPTDLIVS